MIQPLTFWHLGKPSKPLHSSYRIEVYERNRLLPIKNNPDAFDPGEYVQFDEFTHGYEDHNYNYSIKIKVFDILSNGKEVEIPWIYYNNDYHYDFVLQKSGNKLLAENRNSEKKHYVIIATTSDDLLLTLYFTTTVPDWILVPELSGISNSPTEFVPPVNGQPWYNIETYRDNNLDSPTFNQTKVISTDYNNVSRFIVSPDVLAFDYNIGIDTCIVISELNDGDANWIIDNAASIPSWLKVTKTNQTTLTVQTTSVNA